MTASRMLFVFTALAILGSLTGCEPEVAAETSSPVASGTKPTKTASATATPSPTPVVTAARVEIDGDSVRVEASDDSTIIDIPFTTDAATAVGQLNTAIGVPAEVTTSVNDGNCAADTTHYGWGGFELHVPGGYAAAAGAAFVASAKSATTGNGLAVGMPNGLGVGATTASVLTFQPGVPYEGDPASSAYIYYDVKSGYPLGDPDSFYGAAAFASSGVVTSLVSPIFYYYDC